MRRDELYRVDTVEAYDAFVRMTGEAPLAEFSAGEALVAAVEFKAIVMGETIARGVQILSLTAPR